MDTGTARTFTVNFCRPVTAANHIYDAQPSIAVRIFIAINLRWIPILAIWNQLQNNSLQASLPHEFQEAKHFSYVKE